MPSPLIESGPLRCTTPSSVENRPCEVTDTDAARPSTPKSGPTHQFRRKGAAHLLPKGGSKTHDPKPRADARPVPLRGTARLFLPHPGRSGYGARWSLRGGCRGLRLVGRSSIRKLDRIPAVGALYIGRSTDLQSQSTSHHPGSFHEPAQAVTNPQRQEPYPALPGDRLNHDPVRSGRAGLRRAPRTGSAQCSKTLPESRTAVPLFLF
jgi:hypothetical protein